MTRKKPARLLAEWVTLIVSAATILGLIVYLVVELATPASSYVELVAQPVHAEIAQVGGRFVLPVEIENRGGKTAAYAKFRVTSDGQSGTETEFELQYLGRNSRQRVYIYLDRDPRNMNVRVLPLYYRLD
jgi:uncharacterized protein (TIGR02588 family)